MALSLAAVCKEDHSVAGSVRCRLAWLMPLVLPASFFISVVFSPVSLLAVVHTWLKRSAAFAAFSLLTNLGLVFAVGGSWHAGLFLVLVLGPASLWALLLHRRMRPDLGLALAVTGSCLGLLVAYRIYTWRFHLSFGADVRDFIGSLVDQLVVDLQKVASQRGGFAENSDLQRLVSRPDEVKRSILWELPSSLWIGFFVMFLGNFVLALRMNVAAVREWLGIDKAYLAYWKAPHQMVWPAILAGFCVVLELPRVQPLAVNFLRIFVAIYAVQGLAVLSHFFTIWGFRGFFRPLAYVIALVIFLPLVVSLGFFDLWFEFREKLKLRRKS